MPSTLGRALLAVVIALGIGLRFWGLRFGLPHDFARPDEEKIIGPALGMIQGDLNPHLFLYPSLFVYLTASAYALQFGLERAIARTDTRVLGARWIETRFPAGATLYQTGRPYARKWQWRHGSPGARASGAGGWRATRTMGCTI